MWNKSGIIYQLGQPEIHALGNKVNSLKFSQFRKCVNSSGIVIVLIVTNLLRTLMKKIKQSFVEVISGQPRREHYIKVSIVVVSISLVIAVVLTLINRG